MIITFIEEFNEVEVAQLLQALSIKYIEVAPTKFWQDPTVATTRQIDEYREFWSSYGIEIVAFQSMLFNRPDLKIFDPNLQQETYEYLSNFIEVAGRMGAGVMVFGSPKNRQRNNMKIEEANKIAQKFFKKLGHVAQTQGVRFCIEPNAEQYGCDFVVNAQQGVELVETVRSSGFGLHLDIACMTLAGDNITDSIVCAGALLEHFHISSPMLEQVGLEDGVDHASAVQALHSINYDKFVSIEMKPGDVGSNVARVKKAVEFAQATYQ